jgi:hypothetical protein
LYWVGVHGRICVDSVQYGLTHIIRENGVEAIDSLESDSYKNRLYVTIIMSIVCTLLRSARFICIVFDMAKI